MTTVAPPAAPSVEVTFLGQIPDPEYDTLERKGVLMIDGIAYDFVASQASVQPVPAHEEIHDGRPNDPHRMAAIKQRYFRVESKQAKAAWHIVSTVDSRYKRHRVPGVRQVPVTAGEVWGLLCHFEQVSDRIDDLKRWAWLQAFWKMWRVLKPELESSGASFGNLRMSQL